MFRLPKSLILAAAGAGLFTSFGGEGLACPPRGGGGGYRPAYPQQQYQYQYPQQYYQQPACQQPVQPALTQQQLLQQQMLGQQFPQQQQPTLTIQGQGQVAQQPAQGQFAQQGGVQQTQFA